MPDELKVDSKMIRLMTGDITALEIEAFVYYARPDLVLGAGFGGAVAVRGGPKIQEELKKFGTLGTGEAVVTSAGNMKAKFIIHAVGPRFQEEDTEGKLRATTRNVLQKAKEKGIKKLAFPAMGVGFYGIPPDLCARITLEVVKKHLEGQSGLEEVIFCLRDSWEYKAFQERLKKVGANP